MSDSYLTPLVSASLALLAGNFTGGAAERISNVLENQWEGSEGTNMLIGILIDVGLISLGVEFCTKAMPWISSEPSDFALFALGIASATPKLRERLRMLNSWIVPIASPVSQSEVSEMSP